MEQGQIFPLLEKAAQKRVPLRSVTDAVRVVNGFGDELDGLVIEQYGRHVAAQVFDTHWLEERETLTSFVRDRLGAGYFIVKDRSASAAATPDAIRSHVWIDGPSSCAVVEENGLKFEVDLNDGLNSGLFLDMRANRKIVAALSAGRKVLNCFSYTCSFGVYCRAAGAASVVNVDISKKALERGRRNYELNWLVPVGNEFIRASAMDYLTRAFRIENGFDMVILDPPSFARHEGKTFSVKKDLPYLISSAVKVIKPGGVLFAAVNFSEMTHSHLKETVRAASRGRKACSVEALGQDEDFTGSGFMPESYLAAVLVRF